MLCSIIIYILLFSIASSANIELKKTDSTHALYFKSDAYIKNMDKNILAAYNKDNYPYGFYIGKLESKSSGQLQQLTGTLGIKITKKDAQVNEQIVSVTCSVMDLSVAGQGISLFCLNNIDYDSIEISPQTSDTISIENYSKISFTDSVPNGDSMINFKAKYLFFILGLLLFI